MIKKSTGERLEFYEYSDVTVEHLHRYAIAKDFVEGKVVLDIASGEGYGSYLLAERALEVIGVDIDFETIENAKLKYSKKNLRFFVGRADEIPVDTNSIDVVVSFETIEHHDKHNEMLAEIKRVLKKDGLLIMSSPDKEFYSDKTGQNNIYHIKELYFKEFKILIDTHFKQTAYYFQKSYNLNSIVADEISYKEVQIFSGDNLNVVKNEIVPFYNFVIASDNRLYKLKTSIFEGSRIKNLQIMQSVNANSLKIHNTITFKIGKFLCYPFFYVKLKLKKMREN